MVFPFRLTKMVVKPGLVKLRRKSRLGVSCKRALEPVGNLQQGVVQGRTGPSGLHDHRLDDEGRILIAPETVEGDQSGDRRRDHHIDDERAVLERPLRQIELHLGGRPEQPDLLAGMERLDPGSHHDIAGIKALGNDDRPRVVAQQLHISQRHGQTFGVDDPDGRLPIEFGQGGGRELR